MSTRRNFLCAVVAAMAGPLAAQVTPSSNAPRIGVLTLRRREETGPGNTALMQGLRDFGYVDGRNVVIEWPDAQAREDRLPELAAELVRKQVDIILVIGPAPLPAARNATTTIPLVMVASSSDPVAEGVAASLARPGGNVTGLTYAEPDRFKKQLEVLKTVAPNVRRVAVLWDFDVEHFRKYWRTPLAAAARLLALEVLDDPVHVRDPSALPAAFAAVERHHADSLLIAAGGPLFAARAEVAKRAIEHRLPAIAAFKEFPETGLLLSYGPDLPDINRRAGAYVDKILRGAKPGELPIELPSKFQLIVNLRTARVLGLAIPQSVLLRADQVIQ